MSDSTTPLGTNTQAPASLTPSNARGTADHAERASGSGGTSGRPYSGQEHGRDGLGAGVAAQVDIQQHGFLSAAEQAKADAELLPLALYAKASPQERAAMWRTFKQYTTQLAPPSVSTSKPLYSLADEGDRELGAAIGIPDAILVLAKAGIRPPLTLFTASALKTIMRDGLTMTKKYRTLKGDVRVLDITRFPDEADLDFVSWMDAWGGYLRFLADPSITGAGVLQRWETHYRALISMPGFSTPEIFDAILRHDIEERAAYHANPFKADSTQWWMRIAAIQLDIQRQELQDVMRASANSASYDDFYTLGF